MGRIGGMSLLKIARMGHPVLIGRAEPVPDPGAAEIRRLAADMIETMRDAGGVGLAAPQVHLPLRMFVFHLPRARAADAEPIAPMVVINPEIVPLDEEIELGWEGCLSIPGLRAVVPRHANIVYRGVDLEGAPIEVRASGYHGRIVQHETDHLDGVLYPMRVTDFRLFGFDDELARRQPPLAEGA